MVLPEYPDTPFDLSDGHIAHVTRLVAQRKLESVLTIGLEDRNLVIIRPAVLLGYAFKPANLTRM